MNDYYKILGIKPDDDLETIKKAYRELAKVCHPDFNRSPKSDHLFILIKEAYDILSDSEKRIIYDIEMGYYHEDFGINKNYDEDNYENDLDETEPHDEYTKHHEQTASENVEFKITPKPEFSADLMMTLPTVLVFISIIAILISRDFTFTEAVIWIIAIGAIATTIGFFFDFFGFLRDRRNWKRVNH